LTEPAASPVPLEWSLSDHQALFPTEFDLEHRDLGKEILHTESMKMGQRIRQARQAKTLTQQQIADRFKISRAAVAQWEGGDTNPGTAKLEGVAEILGVQIEWLTTGRGPMLSGAESKLFTVPLIDLVTAGDWPEAAGSIELGRSELPTEQKLGVHAFAIEIVDEAMVPEFSPGDRAIVDPAVQPRPGDNVIGRVETATEGILRRYRATTFQDSLVPQVQLIATNPDWAVIDLRPGNGGKLIGTVVESRRYRKR
jgi:transcriptional regulator with XRE-family HTH domain